MCMNSADLMTPCSSLYLAYRRPLKPHNHRIRRLNRRNIRRLSKEEIRKDKMELKNLRLYRENQSIIKDNEKLRKKALLLHQENKALLSLLQKLQTCSLSPLVRKHGQF